MIEGRRKFYLNIAAGALLLIIVLTLIYRYNPINSGLFPSCPFHTATGLYCPGCGSMRALNCLLHGDIGGAFAMNALAVVFIPLLALLSIKPSICYNARLAWFILIALIIYGIIRNIPVWPLELLAPGG